MNILISGGTGFIGRELCRNLELEHHDLWVLSRDPSKVPDCCGQRVTGIGSLDEFPADVRVDAVINLAGEPIADKRWTPEQKKELVDSRVNTTRALVDFMRRQDTPPKVLVSGSAVGFYGDTGAREVTEDSPPTNEFTHKLCRAWEEAALQAEPLGVRVALLRTGLVLGRDGGPLKKMLPAFRMGLGGRISKGDQWMSWIHRGDLLRIIQYLLTDDRLEGPYNATAPRAVMNAQFSKTLGKVLRRPALFPVPAPVLRLGFGEMAHILLTGQKVLPKRLLDSGFEFRFPELEPALQNVLAEPS